MNPIGAGHAYSPTTTSVQAPVGKPPVGLESPQSKNAALPPIEESAAADKARAEQGADKPPAVAAKRDGSGNQQSATATKEEAAAEQAQISELAAVDRKVQAHEAAHSAVAGALAGAKSFSYVTGPDGVRYAVAGEVSIEFGQVADDPEATLRNATQVRAAALAPAEPSAQDFHVAALAGQIIVQAQLDLANQRPTQSGSQPAAQSATPNRQRSANAVRAFDQVKRDQSPPPSLFDQHV